MGAARLLLALAVLSSPAATLRAGEGDPAGVTAKTTLTADLDYQEVAYSIINWGLVFDTGPVAFKKEPEFGTHQITRHALKIGAKANAGVPLAWDRTGGKLYIDLNRNADLTDDTNGVFSTSQRGYYQTFANVRLPLAPESGGATVLVDLNLTERGQQPGGYMALKSYWQGRMHVGERDWQVGVIAEQSETLHAGFLLLRPWERHQESFELINGSADAFSWPPRLFWQQQGYALTAQFRTNASRPQWHLEFTPIETALGELKLTGQGVSRVLLTGGGWTAVLDEPGASARLPEGTYARNSVWLTKGGTTAYLENRYGLPSGSNLTVGAGKQAVLAAGGPLTNRVSVTRHGRLLVFNYQLVGAEGATYRLGREDRSHPPEFAVYHGDKVIATGKFEFG